MNKIPKTITGTVGAWFTSSHYGPAEIAENPDGAAAKLFYSNHDMSGTDWSRAGTATITIELLSPTEMVDAKVDSLNAERKKLMADYQMALTGIDTKLQQLLAITNEA